MIFKAVKGGLYSYGPDIVRMSSVHKRFNKVRITNIIDESVTELPLDNSKLFLKRLYTIGEMAKIVRRATDTIRRYERLGLLPEPRRIPSGAKIEKWRYYTEEDAGDMVHFFSERNLPGRPINKKITKRGLRSKIKDLSTKSNIVSERLNDR